MREVGSDLLPQMQTWISSHRLLCLQPQMSVRHDGYRDFLPEAVQGAGRGKADEMQRRPGL